jgi:ABC-type transporter Mla maintaining outer membrane lipid asymmetry ATPase subunit MlaF
MPVMTANQIIQCRQLIPGDLPFDYQGNALDLTITPGEIVSIIGPNSTDKSHWLKTICGLEDQNSGTVHIRGKDTLHLSAEDWSMTRMKVAYLHTDTALMSAANGLMNVMAPAIYHQLDKKLKKDVLVEKALQLLEQIDPELNLDELPAYISREQQFKIAVARSLLLEPDVLALDSPFTHFDNDSKQQFQSFLIERVKKGLALLIGTRDMSFVLNHSDRILFVEKDELHYFASTAALLECDIPLVNKYIRLNT